ncbi:MAG: hypothetical protein HFG75_04935 [Hungatella sp.]|nr:hypothetical protein [Hungatella sp.]
MESATDQGYELTRRVPDISLDSNEDHLMISEGIYEEFENLFLDGAKLERDVDYRAESGSTRITVRSQTLKGSNASGTHTLGMEFRTKDTGELKRAAQNYKVTGENDDDDDSQGGSGDTSNGGNSGGGGGSSSAGRTSAGSSMITRDPKKGYVHSSNGIITGEEAGYSRWLLEDGFWKLIYADGTMAAGYRNEEEPGTVTEQVLWEKINGSWYPFGADGRLKSGWVYDYQLGSWYLSSIDSGMQTGWYTDPQDRQTYYMEPETGRLAAGWRQIDGSWYYLNGVSAKPVWVFDPISGNWNYNGASGSKPYGALYRDGRTPDGFQVDAQGVWDGSAK